MPKVSTKAVAIVTRVRVIEEFGGGAGIGGGADVDSFHESFEALTQAIRRARGAPVRDAEDLSLSQYALVRVLGQRSDVRIGDLAGEAAIAPSTATRILDTLERRALIRRRREPGDRRVVTVTLTELGRQALERRDAWLRGRQQAFFSALPDAQRALAPDLLRRLAILIDELAAGPGDQG
jgi:DNA-binding MarR family transcriptional regulator